MAPEADLRRNHNDAELWILVSGAPPRKRPLVTLRHPAGEPVQIIDYRGGEPDMTNSQFSTRLRVPLQTLVDVDPDELAVLNRMLPHWRGVIRIESEGFVAPQGSPEATFGKPRTLEGGATDVLFGVFSRSQKPNVSMPPPRAGTEVASAEPKAPAAQTLPAAEAPIPEAAKRTNPASLIAQHTFLLNLNEEALGKDLIADATRRDYDFIRQVLDELSWTDRDDVSLEFMLALPDQTLAEMARSATGQELLDRLFDELTSGEVFDDERVQADRIVKAKPVSTTLDEYTRMITTGGVKIFPFRLPGLTVLNPVPIEAELVGKGIVRVRIPLNALNASDYKAERRTLPREVSLSGLRLRTDEIVGVKFYDFGGQVQFVPALRLVELSHQNDREILKKIFELTAIVATFGTGGLAGAGAEGSLAVRGLVKLGVEASTAARIVIVADQAAFALGLMTLVIQEHRGWILEKFGASGSNFLRAVDAVNSAVLIYGGARVLVETPRLIFFFRDAYRRWRALADAAKDSMDAERQAAVNTIGNEAEKIIKDAEQIQNSLGKPPPKAGEAEPRTRLGEVEPAAPKTGEIEARTRPVAERPTQPVTAEEQGFLDALAKRNPATISDRDLIRELEIAVRKPGRPSSDPGFIWEFDLGNGHVWRITRGGRLCRFSKIVCRILGEDFSPLMPDSIHHIIDAEKARVGRIGEERGRAQATKDGFRESGWINPFKERGEFGQGFDDIMEDAAGNLWILEYKGGGAGLEEMQMSPRWVKLNIDRLESLANDRRWGAVATKWVERLRAAQKSGRLRGRVYSTPIDDVTGEAQTTIRLGKDFTY